MISRPLLMTGMLGAAVAAPIAMTEGPKHMGGFSLGGATEAPAASVPAAPPAVQPIQGPGGLIYESPAPLEGVGFVSLHEMLRMDVSKDWVYARWARKTTGLADPDLFGVRVPVVTGTGMTDLAGSMSYYFNSTGRVDRLKFHGRTADTTALVSVVQQYYGLRPVAAPAGEQLYRAFEGHKIVGELRTRPEAVLWSTSPHSSFVVNLELNRPGVGKYVEPRRLQPDLPPPSEVASSEPIAQNAQPKSGPVAEDAEEPAAESAGSGFGLQDAKRPPFRWPY